jgi:hypothetical protein
MEFIIDKKVSGFVFEIKYLNKGCFAYLLIILALIGQIMKLNKI